MGLTKKAFGFIGIQPDIPEEHQYSCLDAIYAAVDRAKSQGYTTGVTGALTGIELWGGYATFITGLELELILPFKGFENYGIAKEFAKDLQSLDLYRDCLSHAKKLIYAEEVPTDFLQYTDEESEKWTISNLQRKNNLIVDKVSLLITLWDYQEPYLLPNLRYAHDKKVKIANLNPLNAQWKALTREDLYAD